MYFYSDEVISICGIDPGTSSLGFSHGMLDTQTGHLEIVSAYTIDGDTLVNGKDRLTLNLKHGKRQARMYCIADKLAEEFCTAQPDICIIEDFFSARNIKTYGTLMATQQMVMMSLHFTCPLSYVRVIKPGIGKNSFGVKGNSGDKQEMVDAVPTLTNTTFPDGFLDEVKPDTADAIAQMYAFVVDYRRKHNL